MNFGESPAPSPENPAPLPEEVFFLTQEKVLEELFGEDEEGASKWLLEGEGFHGKLLRESTERHLRLEGSDPRVIEKIADELRA